MLFLTFKLLITTQVMIEESHGNGGQLRRSSRILEKSSTEECEVAGKKAKKRCAKDATEEESENEVSFSKANKKMKTAQDPYAIGLKGYQPSTSKKEKGLSKFN